MGKSRNEVNRIFTSDSPAIFIINFSIHNLLTYKCHGHCIVVFFLTQLIVVIFEEKKVKKKNYTKPKHTTQRQLSGNTFVKTLSADILSSSENFPG